MRKRVFIAINLPDEVRKKIEQEMENLKPLFGPEIRFLNSKNWHLTISFLGHQDDNSTASIVQITEKAAKNFEFPVIEFEKIIYGPPGKTPRMIWLIGSPKTSKNLSSIKNYLEDTIADSRIKFKREDRLYNAHLTLARFERAPKTSLPTIEKNFAIKFEAESLDLMESHLKKSGAEYELLSKFNFSSSFN